MHRFLGRFVIGASALLIAATAQAQGTAGTAGRPFKLGGSLGASVPTGDFGDVSSLGFHLGGLIEYKPASLPLSLRGELTYHRNGLNDDAFGDIDGNFSQIDFVGNALVPLGTAASTARPYVIGGLGLYRLNLDVDGADDSDAETKLGLNFGAGLTFNLSGFETFVETRFHSVFADGSNMNFIPLSFGFKF